MRPIAEIIVHCAATQQNWMHGKSLDQKIEEIRRWHRSRGWSDIGYHFVIDRNGDAGLGRPIGRTGAHVKGHNTGTIGVCLLGGHGSAATDRFSDNFTIKQDVALRDLIAKLRRDFPHIQKISGHNEYSNKACPGFTVGNWLMSDSAPPATEAPPQGAWAAIIAVILSIFGGKK